jgi:multiple sugar transport system permease protein
MRSRRWIGATVLSMLALTMLAPFLYMVSVSLMDETEVLRWPPPLLPAAPHTDNYAAVLEALPFRRLFLNSVILAGCVMVGQVFTSAAAGYAFARMRFPGRDRVCVAFLAVLAIPAIVLLIPRFLMIETLGWVNTYTGLISTELVSVWGIFLMRQFFVTLPREVEDAARLDGAGEWTLFWRVMLPLAQPAVAALAVLSFLDQWRSFLWPLIVTRSAEMQVVEVGLASIHTAYATNWPFQMAAAVAVTLPLLVVCLGAQRYLMHGLQVTGPK